MAMCCGASLLLVSDGAGLLAVDAHTGQVVRRLASESRVLVAATPQLGPCVLRADAPPQCVDGSGLALDALGLCLRRSADRGPFLLIESAAVALDMASTLAIIAPGDAFASVIDALREAAHAAPPCVLPAANELVRWALLALADSSASDPLEPSRAQCAALCCLEQLREQTRPRRPGEDADDVHVELVRRMRSLEFAPALARHGLFARGGRLAHLSGLWLPADAEAAVNADPAWELARLLAGAPTWARNAARLNVPLRHSLAARALTRGPSSVAATSAASAPRLVAASGSVLAAVHGRSRVIVYARDEGEAPHLRAAFEFDAQGAVGALAVAEAPAAMPSVDDGFLPARTWRQEHVAVVVVSQGARQGARGYLAATSTDASQPLLVRFAAGEPPVALDADAVVEPARPDDGDCVLVTPEADGEPARVGTLLCVSGEHPVACVFFGADCPPLPSDGAAPHAAAVVPDPCRPLLASQLYAFSMTRVLALSPAVAARNAAEKRARELDGAAAGCSIVLALANDDDVGSAHRVALFSRRVDRTTAEVVAMETPCAIDAVAAFPRTDAPPVFFAHGVGGTVFACDFALRAVRTVWTLPASAAAECVALGTTTASAALFVVHNAPHAVVHALALTADGSLAGSTVARSLAVPATAVCTDGTAVWLALADGSFAAVDTAVAPSPSLLLPTEAPLSLRTMRELHANVKWSPLRFAAHSGRGGRGGRGDDIDTELVLADGGSRLRVAGAACLLPAGRAPCLGRAVLANALDCDAVATLTVRARLAVVATRRARVPARSTVAVELGGVAGDAVVVEVAGDLDGGGEADVLEVRLWGRSEGSAAVAALYDALVAPATQVRVIRQLAAARSGAETRAALRLLLDRLDCGAAFAPSAAELRVVLRAFVVRDGGNAGDCLTLLRRLPADDASPSVFAEALAMLDEACAYAATRAGLVTLGQVLLEFWPDGDGDAAVRERLMAKLVECARGIAPSPYASVLRACFGEFGCTVMHDALPEGNAEALEPLSVALAQQGRHSRRGDTATPPPASSSSLAASSTATAAAAASAAPLALRVHSATYNSSTASHPAGFEVTFVDVLRNKDNAVVLDLGQVRLVSSVEVAVATQEPFPDSCVSLACVETWLSHPPVAGDRVLMLGRGVALELYAISGSFSFDKRDCVIGVKSTFPTVAPRGVCIKQGAWYYEVALVKTTDGVAQIGWCDASFSGDDKSATGTGDDEHSWAFDGYRTKKWNGGPITWGRKWVDGDVVGCAIDLDERTVHFSLNGSWKRPMGLAFSDIAVDEGVFPAVTGERSFKCSLNFGQAPFRHSPPAPHYRPLIDWVLEHHRAHRDVQPAARGEHVWLRAALSPRTPQQALAASASAPDLVEARYVRVAILNRDVAEPARAPVRAYAPLHPPPPAVAAAALHGTLLASPATNAAASHAEEQGDDEAARRGGRPRVPVRVSVRAMVSRRLLPMGLDHLAAQAASAHVDVAKGRAALLDARARVAQAIDALPLESVDPAAFEAALRSPSSSSASSLSSSSSVLDKARPLEAAQRVVDAVAEAQRVQVRLVDAATERLRSVVDALLLQGSPASPPRNDDGVNDDEGDVALARSLEACSVLTSLCLARPPRQTSLDALRTVFAQCCLLAPHSPAHQSAVLDLVHIALAEQQPDALAAFGEAAVLDVARRPPQPRLAAFLERRLCVLLEALVAKAPACAPAFERRLCDLLARDAADGSSLALAGLCLALVHRARALALAANATAVAAQQQQQAPSASLLGILLLALNAGHADLALLLFDLVAAPRTAGEMHALVTAAARSPSPFVHDALAAMLLAHPGFEALACAVALEALRSTEYDCDPACLLAIVLGAMRRGHARAFLLRPRSAPRCVARPVN